MVTKCIAQGHYTAAASRFEPGTLTMGGPWFYPLSDNSSSIFANFWVLRSSDNGHVLHYPNKNNVIITMDNNIFGECLIYSPELPSRQRFYEEVCLISNQCSQLMVGEGGVGAGNQNELPEIWQAKGEPVLCEAGIPEKMYTSFKFCW